MKKMISISTALSIFIFSAFIVALILHGIYNPQLRDYKRMKERQADRYKLELREQGGTALYYPPNWDKEKDGSHFNYMIHSWDGGKTWYATEYDKDCEGGWGIRILGDASVMYPGLIEHIVGWRQLTKYVEDNGSIGGDDQLGIDALKNAGFTVKIDTVTQ